MKYMKKTVAIADKNDSSKFKVIAIFNSRIRTRIFLHSPF